MSAIQFTAAYGKVNLANHIQMCSANALLPPWSAKSFTMHRRRVSSGSPVNVGVIAERGTFYSATMEYEEGEIVSLSCQRSFDRIPAVSGTVFIRLRASGPLWHIDTKMLASPENRLGTHHRVFEGRGDILSMDELRTLGYVPRYVSFEEDNMDPAEIDMLFEFVQAERELTPRPELLLVEAEDGTKKAVMVSPAPRRRLVLRK